MLFENRYKFDFPKITNIDNVLRFTKNNNNVVYSPFQKKSSENHEQDCSK